MWQPDGRTDRQRDGKTDRQTENTICRAAWSQLKTIGHLFYATSSFAHHFKAIRKLKLKKQSGNAQFRSKSAIFFPCDLEIWWMTLKNNTAPLLCYFKLCASFRSHWWIQTGGQSGNAQFGSNSTIFLAVWPRNLMNDLGNNRAPLLCCFKLCAIIHGNQWILTGVTVRKCPIWVKINDFFSRVTLKFDRWPSITIGHLFYATSSFVHHFKAIVKLKLKLQSGNAQFGWKLEIFCPVWPWNLTDDLEKQKGTSSMPLQALFIISKPLVN